MGSVDAILEFFEVPSGDAFDVAPARAIEFFKAKGLKPSFSYADMLGEANDHAFTVAKLMDLDMLAQVRTSLDSALANGQSFAEWKDTIMPVLQSGGWWGKKKVIDPKTGVITEAQLGSPWRLETIFRTQMQSAYAAGHWQEIEAQADVAPFLMYDAVDDFRTRPLHASWDRKVLPVTHKWWHTHYPPNGYNCRCGVIQLDAEQLQQLGLTQSKDAPDDGTVKWTNPRTGQVLDVPRGIDPGFDKNAGLNFKAATEKLLQEKAQAQGAKQAAAIAKAKAQAMADAATSAAAQAQAEIAAATAKAALERAQAIAAKKAAQAAAQAQIDAIAKGKTADPGKFLATSLKKAKALPSWPDLTPEDKLAAVQAMAADAKAKHALQSKLSVYKKAILEGKTPPPSAVKAFKSLPEDEAGAFLAKVGAEKAKLDAAKAAEAAKQAAQQDATPKAAGMLADTPPDPATMTMIARKEKGATEGAFYQDTATGAKYLVKFPGSEDAVRNEVLAAKLYNLAGAQAPELHAIVIDGRPALASRLIDGIVEVDAATLAATPSVADGFAVDAWLANWDTVGLSFDNIVLVGGRAVRIDVGGSLRYRAMGGLKGSAFGDRVTELESLRDASLNRQSFEVFGRLTAQQIEDSVVRVLRVSDEDVAALVAKYGPLDAAEAKALTARLIARKRDLATRFPAAAQRVKALDGAADTPPPASARVTATEQRFVEESRVNGYGFATDSDQVEDNMVVVHTYATKDGAKATRGFLKLMPGASDDLLKRVKAGGAGNAVPLGSARDAILSAVKSINYRAGNGQPMDATVVMKVTKALTEIDATVKALGTAAAGAKDAANLQSFAQSLQGWRELLAPYQTATAGQQVQKIAKVFMSQAFPDELSFVPRMAGPAQAVTWRRVTGTYEFETASFDRSHASENGGKSGVYGASLRYEADLPDGTRVVYFPHDSAVVYAMQGVVKIDTPGRGIKSTERVFETLDSMGIAAVRSTEIDRQHLYLNAFARLRLIRTPAYQQFKGITDKTAEGVRAKLDIIRKATGIEVEKSEGWAKIDGVRQAFGHGRAYQIRPDLDTQQLAALNKTHVIFHNPQGLGTSGGRGVFERLKPVIEGGGTFASLTDRVRRGVPLSGSSVMADLDTGGGDYHFTRVRKRSSQDGTGVYWRATVLRRADAISYDSDQFGTTKGDHVEHNREGQSIESFKALAGNSSNETIFKGGLSIFDDLDRIVLADKAEVNAAIAWLKSKGYKLWPDGRALEDVIMTQEKHRAQP